MRISAFCTAVLAYVVIGHAPPAAAQVDQQRAQEYFKEAQALCERAARYAGAELRAAEEQREQQRQARIAGLRQRFVDGPVFVMPCGGGGVSNSLGAVVIPARRGDYRSRAPAAVSGS